MSDDFEMPEMARREKVTTFLVVLGVVVGGLFRVWQLVPVGAMALLFLSDRGQHRWLIERFAHLGRGMIATITIGAHLLNNLFFCALAYASGVIIPWLWGI